MRTTPRFSSQKSIVFVTDGRTEMKVEEYTLSGKKIWKKNINFSWRKYIFNKSFGIFSMIFLDFSGDFPINYVHQSGDPGPQICSDVPMSKCLLFFWKVVLFRGRYLRAQEELDNVLGCFDCVRDQKFHFRTSRTSKNKSNRSKTQNVTFFLCTELYRNQLSGEALILKEVPEFLVLFAFGRDFNGNCFLFCFLIKISYFYLWRAAESGGWFCCRLLENLKTVLELSTKSAKKCLDLDCQWIFRPYFLFWENIFDLHWFSEQMIFI